MRKRMVWREKREKRREKRERRMRHGQDDKEKGRRGHGDVMRCEGRREEER